MVMYFFVLLDSDMETWATLSTENFNVYLNQLTMATYSCRAQNNL